MSDAGNIKVSFHLNGTERHLEVAPEYRLADILRNDLSLTASKTGCGIGRCGSCMVLMNGRAVNGCLLMAWQLEGADIVSPEGLDAFATARIVKAALVEENAFQCGYCAPGITATLTALILEHPFAGEADIIAALEGNICRCTGYHSIIRGALAAAERLRDQPHTGEHAYDLDRRINRAVQPSRQGVPVEIAPEAAD
ncbi:(2Fe-2S)-binding protein [Rhizobium sp. S152]|uniref:(2Fe-2S)-binding protein n=1 Tax=Rhizobium sp. S152 TaxID=3055038 RepID=UPI0025A9C3FC|nr:(2Fe-2S)-binding protein [Rhizobium sp. S152]MDM9624776.1 (2Fe-2S)-binding protein [Rhizobium sp. S152]